MFDSVISGCFAYHLGFKIYSLSPACPDFAAYENRVWEAQGRSAALNHPYIRLSVISVLWLQAKLLVEPINSSHIERKLLDTYPGVSKVLDDSQDENPLDRFSTVLRFYVDPRMIWCKGFASK